MYAHLVLWFDGFSILAYHDSVEEHAFRFGDDKIRIIFTQSRTITTFFLSVLLVDATLFSIS